MLSKYMETRPNLLYEFMEILIYASLYLFKTIIKGFGVIVFQISLVAADKKRSCSL